MAEREISTHAWIQLLTRMAAVNERLHAVDPTRPHTSPNRGATKAQLAAAEQRIGHRLPAQYRQLLAIANGWDLYFRGTSLLGTEDIGQGQAWHDAHHAVGCAFAASKGALAATLGTDDDPSNCIPVSWGENGWHTSIVVFVDDARGARSGEAFVIGGDSPRAADLYTRLYDEMLSHIDDLDRAERGPHSATWGRDIRIDPPSTADVLDQIRRLTRRLGLASWSRPVRPGATDADLDRLAAALGGGLHPDHRDLLAHSDGLALMQRTAVGPASIPYLNVLSVEEILAGDRWAQSLAAEQQLHDAGSSVLETVTAERLVPFGVDVGPIGVDPTDGRLRWVCDSVTRQPQRQQSIREMLLDHCDQLYERLTTR